MTPYILDANGILRYLLNDIPSQADYVEALIRSAEKGEVTISVSTVVLVETVFALLRFYKEEKHVIVRQILVLVENPLIDMEERMIVKQALELWKDYGLSFVDCLLIAEVRNTGKKLFTFDKKLAKLANKISKI